jgi:hypothetical protein
MFEDLMEIEVLTLLDHMRDAYRDADKERGNAVSAILIDDSTYLSRKATDRAIGYREMMDESIGIIRDLECLIW